MWVDECFERRDRINQPIMHNLIHPGLPDIINSDIRFWDGIRGHCTEPSSDFKVIDFVPLTDALG